jgi:ferritin-like metal-binding protein YciE
MATTLNPALRTVLVTGLQNAHAVENQALSLIDRQLDRLIRYPEIADRLRTHRLETEDQIRRLDDILGSLGERASSFKDIALGFMGNMAALGNVMAADEVLKNQFVNGAFENFEVASYTSLVTLADAAELPTAAALLRETLEEEIAMAAWVQDSVPALTLKYVGLRTGGGTAGH